MGITLSKHSKLGKGSNYEKVLAELDSQIASNEVSLAETRISERRTSVYFFFYSLLFTFSIVTFLFVTRNSGTDRTVLLDIFLIFGLPWLLYYLKKATSFYYRRKIGVFETALQTLRQKQQMKLEELKDSTAYYQTRGLIERFDPEFKMMKKDGVIPEDIPIKPVANSGKNQPISKNNVPVPCQEKISFVIPSEPKKTWMDRLVDAMIGDDSRHSKYALICQRCHAHNGLALPDEITSLVYVCPNCHFENKPKPRDNIVINGENVYTPIKDNVDSGPSEQPETPQAIRQRIKTANTTNKF